MNVDTPSELQLDALREVANVGCGHAASALSQLVGGRRVVIDVPRALVTRVVDVTEVIGGIDQPVVAATLDVLGGLTGRMLLVMPERDAHRLCEILLNEASEGELEGAQKSAIGEVANIVASACLSAIAKLAGFKLTPSVPRLIQDSAGSVIDSLSREANGDQPAVVLEARFSTESAPPVCGQLLMLPDAGSIRQLLSRLGV